MWGTITRHPSTGALLDKARESSYCALDERANHLTHLLARLDKDMSALREKRNSRLGGR